jgi:hypothetical protein
MDMDTPYFSAHIDSRRRRRPLCLNCEDLQGSNCRALRNMHDSPGHPCFRAEVVERPVTVLALFLNFTEGMGRWRSHYQ